YYNRYDIQVGEPYLQLMKLLEGKNYFVITTNVDHQMQLAGVDKNKFYYMPGDYGLWQCSEPCHQKTYDNKEQVQRMVDEQRDMKIPTYLIPHCPKCGRPMTMNLRIDSTFVQDEGWYAAQKGYTAFVEKHKDKPIVLLELGVGFNTPMIIKYPFMRMADDNIDALYVLINMEKQTIPFEIQHNTIAFNDDILKVLNDLLS
ncbi:Sir2 silent information regulator family NAD-dependent deacetylase, partial [Veillonella sp.]|uniref:Sir2 silent information regulator family NAD-dependent deacetylase n=1 Tax=Veillonella sp. TaxID=1926307 RepID=UPI00257D8C64